MDTILVFKNTSKKGFMRYQWLGKQNSFSQSKDFPFLEPEEKYEDLQGSLFRGSRFKFQGFGGVCISDFGLEHFTGFQSQYCTN